MAEEESIAYVNVLWEHQNTLWVGTAKGVFALDLSSREVRRFTAEQFGLSANGILALTADSQGNIWMGTSGGGVLRYDGQTFQSIRLGPSALENKVEAVLCDRRGRLWFGTRAGLVAYQPGHTPPRLVIREVMAGTLLAEPEVVSCPESTPEIRIHFQGISFRTGAGQMRYSHRLLGHEPTEQWSAFTAANAIAYSALPVGEYCFEVRTMDRDGLLSEVASVEIRVLPDAKTERIHALENVLRATDHVVHSQSWAMRQVAQDAAGHLWIAFHYIGKEAVIGRYDPQQQQFDLIDVGSELEDGEMVQHGMRDVRLDKRGWLWVARRGVLVYDGQDWHPFSARLPSAHFADTRLTYEDREGNIWVGLWGGGLVFCDPVSTQLYSEADGLPNKEIRCLDEDREGRIWVGTAGGLACLEDDQIRPVATDHAVSALVVDQQGQLWSGGADGQVFKWEGTTPRAMAIAEADHHEDIAGLCQDQTGRIRVCTSQGRFGWIEADGFTAFEERLPHPCRTVLQDCDGVFWIGTHGRRPALYCHTDGLFRESELTELEAISYVNALYEHEGTLWVGTANGLFAFDHHSQQVRWFTMDQGGRKRTVRPREGGFYWRGDAEDGVF